jgi:hypothetical protein
MNDLPNNILEKIHTLVIDDANKARLKSTSKTQRRISQSTHPDLYTGEKSYLVKDTGARYQDLYDNWQVKYEEARERFIDSPQFYNADERVFRRKAAMPRLVHQAKSHYEKGTLLHLVHQTWKKKPRASVEHEFSVRIRRRLKQFIKERKYKAKYQATLHILRRWKKKPNAEEETKYATFAMDAILKESLQFF